MFRLEDNGRAVWACVYILSPLSRLVPPLGIYSFLSVDWSPRGAQVVRPEDTLDSFGVFVLRKGFCVMVTSAFNRLGGQ
eukprot:7974289-Pyramimonas_sp.AAC.1